LHDAQGVTPIEQAAEPDQGKTCGIRSLLWLDMALLIQRQLLAQKEFSAARAGYGCKQSRRKHMASTKSVSSVPASCSRVRNMDINRVIITVSLGGMDHHYGILSQRGDVLSRVLRMELLRSTGDRVTGP
jgi:hypothetical protein